jgi:beta-galactosidase
MYDYTGLDCYKMAKHVDFVSWDSYPTWHKQQDILTAYNTGMQHDLMRSMKHKAFLLMESCPSSPNWKSVSKLNKPGLLMNASLQAVAHGSNSVQFFQIRQGRGGFEKFHGAVIDHYGGEDTRIFREVTEIGNVLKHAREITENHVQAPVAVLYDMESRWAMEDAKGPRNQGLFYHETALKSYVAFRKGGVNVDIINVEQPLEQYQIIAAPMLYMFRAGIEEKLRLFVQNGGILVMTYWSGIVNETDLCHLGGTPHGLTDVLGLRSEEVDGLYDGETNRFLPVQGNELGLEQSYTCRHLCDLIRLKGAVPLMEYADDFYKGYPAVTVHRYGAGLAYYIGADADAEFYQDLYQSIMSERQIRPILDGIPEGIEVSSRINQDFEYVFIQNYTCDAIAICLPDDIDILSGNYDGMIWGYSTIIFQRKNSDVRRMY